MSQADKFISDLSLTHEPLIAALCKAVTRRLIHYSDMSPEAREDAAHAIRVTLEDSTDELLLIDPRELPDMLSDYVYLSSELLEA